MKERIDELRQQVAELTADIRDARKARDDARMKLDEADAMILAMSAERVRLERRLFELEGMSND